MIRTIPLDKLMPSPRNVRRTGGDHADLQGLGEHHPAGRVDRHPIAVQRHVDAAFGIQSCAWGYTNTFNLWNDNGGWITQIRDAIATTTTVQ